MRIVQVNPVCNGSTGKIAVEISKLLDRNGIENYILYSLGQSDFKNAVKYTSEKEIKWNALFSKVSGRYGFHSVGMTKRLIEKLDEIKPDVVQLHNLHSHNVHLGMLLGYLKKRKIKVFWTMHDCWAFTAYCTHFDYAACNKWQKGCQACPLRRAYSLFFDRSATLYKWKKEAAEGLDLTVITPSAWLGELVKQSFLGEYPIRVIPNGINLDLFKPTESDFRKKYGLAGKKIYLSVAAAIGPKKGFNYLLQLAEKMDPHTHMVLVGVSEEQIKALPKNVLGITRTADQKELAAIYAAADVFLNCTLEDTFPTVNLEALACGTPVVTFRTGGSPECVDEKSGSVVPQKDVAKMAEEAAIWAEKDATAACRQRAERMFRAEERFQDYINLYKG